MNSLQKNNTFELIELSKGNKEMKNKWIFKLKKNGEKKIVKYKARCVVKGLSRSKELILMWSSFSCKNELH